MNQVLKNVPYKILPQFKHVPYQPEQPMKLNQPYITALWEADRLPSEFKVGDGMHYGGYWNRELTKDTSYVLLVRGAYGQGEVGMTSNNLNHNNWPVFTVFTVVTVKIAILYQPSAGV